ncbi:hypothetical protein LCG56_20710 [Pseudomonas cannabina pv. alisalensis]|uniref:Uncharacterized protein n=1 Tax=Pseudomonas syringae pv. maculicola str. ES4326 TaxID=629265 RepID=A0A8T8BWI9_PSEYM|nr:MULTISPECIES: hypothetical protein [Pseudomonas syringae group]KPB74310.1 Uncharacterized protein AC507_3080 [Pseudomonas syringae pv. maculicola]QHE95748.1 hypothetical protein PMA4326_003300 [Pseudomonas syringae pv. maculicola str. ES4326]UBY96383.1 hypothetical protein LCG56_20710 [Pseudomonas cannabina pv. alisalensis]
MTLNEARLDDIDVQEARQEAAGLATVKLTASWKIDSFVTPWMSSISTTGILSYESSS